LEIAAMLERADVRDRIIGAGSIGDLPEGAVVGTSSPRRSAQIRRLRPDIRTTSIRGNVDTRIGKQASGEVDATLLAAAGLDRLGREEVGVAVELSDMLPAPAQGAIGIECRADDAMTATLLKSIDHPDTRQAVLAERAFCRALGGTCHSPVAAYARLQSEWINFACEILSEDGRERIAEEARFAVGDLETPALLARAMLDRAPPEIRRLFEAQ
jgi:hydroxymethylbilane synthase